MVKAFEDNFLLRLRMACLGFLNKVRSGISGFFGRDLFRGRKSLAVLSIFTVIFIVALVLGYTLRPVDPQESPPLLMVEETGPIDVIGAGSAEDSSEALARLEQEVAEIRARMEEITGKKEKKEPVFDPSEFGRPASGRIIRGPGWMRMANEWRFHSGVDFYLPQDSSVLASADGVVSEVGMDPLLGMVVCVDHGAGWKSIYGHLGGVNVSLNQEVKKGVILGLSSESSCGSEPGFHFALQYQGRSIDPRTIIQGL